MDAEAGFSFFERAYLFIDNHESIRAVLLGWFFAIPATQAIKLWFPPWYDVLRVKRTTQLFAVMISAAVTFIAWPVATPHGIVYAIMSGMSCPQLYTALKWLLPNLMARWGWTCIKEKKIERAQE